ncbi:MAG: 3-deoxy-manno-octulosonate cytidylyltransferase [Planctomycetaceae bacterium]|nr:3-deoxy-manno-octulosonate cytidylyltransferase [Planctomycetaceae bacterium]
MGVAIIIPARLQSTRLPNKLLLEETGMPLICHTAARAVEIRDAAADVFSDVIVAADHESIIAAVEKWAAASGKDVQAVMTDPDHQSGSDRIAEAACSLPAGVDAVLNLQGDEPDIPVDAVVALAEFYFRTGPDIATLVYPITDLADRQNPSLVKPVLGAEGRALYFSRADIPFRRDGDGMGPPSYGHVGIYLYRRTSLERFVALPPGQLEQTEKLEQLRALENGMVIRALILDEKPPKGIDTVEDYEGFVKSVKK